MREEAADVDYYSLNAAAAPHPHHMNYDVLKYHPLCRYCCLIPLVVVAVLDEFGDL